MMMMVMMGRRSAVVGRGAVRMLGLGRFDRGDRPEIGLAVNLELTIS
jgi:hypothetical protein